MGSGRNREPSTPRPRSAEVDGPASPGGRPLVAALATADRLRVFAAVVLGARRPTAIAAASGVPDAGVVTALSRLQKAGLVTADADGFHASPTPFAAVARASAPVRRPADFGTDDPEVTAVLNAFLREGRIVSMPAHRGKRRVVLEHVIVMFEPGRRYSEREVNVILASFYDDTATLRRYLVDERLLDRADGRYWRIGGWVDVLDGSDGGDR